MSLFINNFLIQDLKSFLFFFKFPAYFFSQIYSDMYIDHDIPAYYFFVFAT